MSSHRSTGPGWRRLAHSLAGRATPLEAHEFVVAAMRRTGLPDVGDGPFGEPLEILGRSLEVEAGLTPLGRRAAHEWLVTTFSARARLAELLRRGVLTDAPPPVAPLVITGLPGSGGGILRNLLSSHPALRIPNPRDVLDPSGTAHPPPREEGPCCHTPDELPTAQGGPASDDGWWMGFGVASWTFERAWHVPAWAEWFDGADLTDAYRWLRTALNRAEARADGAATGTGGAARRWLLGSSQHLERLTDLATGLPGAVVVQIHRDPAALVPALALHVAEVRRWSSAGVDTRAVGRYWSWRVERALSRNLAQREAGVAAVDVTTSELALDPRGVLERILAAVGLDLNDGASDSDLPPALATPPLDGPAPDPTLLGLDAAPLGRTFAPYRERFEVPPEA